MATVAALSPRPIESGCAFGDDRCQNCGTRLMLLTLALLLSALTLLLSIALAVLRRPLASDFHSGESATSNPQHEQLPAAVILCVRGADPTLPACLDGLLTQDHPDHEIHIVMDSESDPAASVIDQAIARYPSTRVQVHILQDRNPRRGLKVSAILHALSFIPDSVPVIAFLDSDAEPQADWLCQLAGPLQSPEVGATTGVRWFEPSAGNVWSLVRAKWNLYAVILMRYFNIAWGGSFAIRRDVIEKSGLLSRWSESICEDTCVGDVLAAAGYRVRMVPAVAMVNRETTDLSGCWRFMVRQLVFTRMHSRSWLMVLTFGLAFMLLSILVPVSTVASLAGEHWWAFALLAFSWLMLHIAITQTEQLLAGLSRKHNTEAIDHARTLPVARRGAAMHNLLIQFLCVTMSGCAIIQAGRTRVLTWRGISYRLHQSGVTLIEYVPFTPERQPETELQGMSI